MMVTDDVQNTDFKSNLIKQLSFPPQLESNHHFFRESRESKNKKKEREDKFSIVRQQGGLLYLDDKMTASAGTKSLPFTLIISPTSTCENKLVTVGHCLQNHTKGNIILT